VTPPDFWSGPPGLAARLLFPLGWIYGEITARRMARPGRRASLPVICVGNFTVGGAGKTPAVIMLAEALAARGERPFVVSRGYGGRLAGPVRVDRRGMTAADCGDEPLLIARRCPVVVARDRYEGASFAAAEGATVLVLDDGMQSPALAKDFTLAAIDADAPFGNGFCLPAGPLRAPVDRQIRHVDAVIAIGDASSSAVTELGKPLFAARIVPDPGAVAALGGRRLLAFAGIGRPGKFFETLSRAGLDVAAAHAFPDHHPYGPDDLARLRRAAAGRGLTLVTTEKDRVRLPHADDIATLPISLALDGAPLLDAVAAAIVRRRSEP